MNASFSSVESIKDLKLAFRAGSLATNLKSAVSVSIDADPAVGYKRLLSLDFDQAPVKSGKKSIGWVLTKEVRTAKSIGEVMKPLADSTFVSADASIGTVVEKLTSTEFVFTVSADGLQGFICASDLDRHVVRAYFSMLTSQIEMILAHIVKGRVPEGLIIDRITGDETHLEGRSLKKQFMDARKAGKDTHPVEYLFLNQLIELLPVALPEVHPKILNPIVGFLETVKQGRNYVAHSTRRMASSSAAIRLRKLDIAFSELIERLPRLLEVD